jgi:hypothetical protein
MKIMPHVQTRLTLLLPDGNWVDVPFQVFLNNGGDTVIRLGDTILVFDKEGVYDGPEYHLHDDMDHGAFTAAYTAADDTYGEPPEEAFFQPDTSGWKREVAGWAFGRKRKSPGKGYEIKHDAKGRKGN